MLKAIVNAKIVNSDGIIDNQVVIFGKQINAIVPKDELARYSPEVTIDAKGAYLSAGFIDLHIHGNGGADVMDATPDALETIALNLTRSGTTSFLATTMSMSQDRIFRAIDNIVSCLSNTKGANVLGVHLEGPFLSLSQVGAQDKSALVPPQIEWIEKYHQYIKMITFAPEESYDFTREISRLYPDIVLSIGHSNASFKEAKKAFSCGVRHATHLGNAMSKWHHREPGVIGAVLDDDRVTCDMIADGLHLHDATLRLFWKIKQEKLALITDAIRATFMGDGEYDLGGQCVHVTNNTARLKNGALAGSVLKLNEALRKMSQIGDIAMPQLIASVTKVPAEILRLKNKGFIKSGADADMVLFDENFDILTTIVGGEIY